MALVGVGSSCVWLHMLAIKYSALATVKRKASAKVVILSPTRNVEDEISVLEYLQGCRDVIPHKEATRTALRNISNNA